MEMREEMCGLPTGDEILGTLSRIKVQTVMASYLL